MTSPALNTAIALTILLILFAGMVANHICAVRKLEREEL